MTPLQSTFLIATLLAAAGVWLMLPGRGIALRFLGAALGLAGLGLLAGQVGSLGHWARDSVFWILAGVTVVAAAATISFRNPMYCAIWFALSLLGTASLFMFQGSQFLAMATVVVYAGAIVVTFLFVLMLAQPRGQAPYDRVSWEALLSASAGAVLIGILTLTLASVVQTDDLAQLAAEPQERDQSLLADDHVAHLGGQLYSRYLLAVEVGGLLLLVAIVGAAAIAIHSRRGVLQITDLRSFVEEAARGNPATPEKAPTHG